MTLTLKRLYVGLFLAVLLGLGAWSARSFVDFSAPAEGKVVQGQWAKAFEAHYDKEFPIKRLGTNLWAALDYRVFGEGRPGVVLGREDWLYSDEEFKPVANAQQQIQDNWALIQGVHKRLAAQNIQLVLAILPAKARLYPEHFGEVTPAALHGDLFQQFQARARAEGLQAPDLLAPLELAKLQQGPVFLRTDTHWTPLGAEVVAEQLGASIRRDTPLGSEAQRFVTEAQASETYTGDLTRFLPLDPLFSEMLPPPDRLQSRKTRLTEDATAQGDGDLFGEAQIPVALVGTSYSANPLWNFAGALRQALGSDLVNHSEDGKGPILPMLTYLQSEALKSAPPRLVIWEFPERYLPLANDLADFDPAWIAQLKQPETPPHKVAHLSSTPSITPTRAQH